MNSVWDHVLVSLQSDINTLRIINHFSITIELGLDLNVKVGVLIGIQSIEFTRISTVELVVVRSTLMGILRD